MVEELTHDPELFRGVDMCIYLGRCGYLSREFADDITRHGAIMIDNSSAFRMDADVPLVVPEVNGQDAFDTPATLSQSNAPPSSWWWPSSLSTTSRPSERSRWLHIRQPAAQVPQQRMSSSPSMARLPAAA